MYLVLPFYSDDAWLMAKNIKHWISMEKHTDHACMLVYDRETDYKEVKMLAQQFFSRVMEHNCGMPPSRDWPKASNYVFQNTVWEMFSRSKKKEIPEGSWLWVESDSVAMKPGWIDAIEKRHKEGRKLFTGHLNKESNVWNGVSVYPPAEQVMQFTNMMLCSNNPWDVVGSQKDRVLQNLNEANDLFQHNWADPATDKAYTFTCMQEVRAIVRDSVVLFHRCKDGSLIDVLQRGEDVVKCDTQKPEPELKKKESYGSALITLPFCKKDVEQQKLNLQLMAKLDEPTYLPCLLSFDDATPPGAVAEMDDLARNYFGKVYHYCYEAPKSSKWPEPQNWAWWHVAEFIEKHFDGGWLWLESDAVPLKPGWLSKLVSEYASGGQPYMGYIVETMGHMNGVGFYPCKLSKTAPGYQNFKKAFDIALRVYTAKLTHNANHLFQNVWSFLPNGNHSLGQGKAPSFHSMEDVDKLVDFSKVIFHRCKDGSLQRLLLKKYDN